jgi:anti-sigma factor ChrR (cupin superfamily)
MGLGKFILVGITFIAMSNLLSAPASAKNADFMCQVIKGTADGKFTYEQMPGYSVLSVVQKDGTPKFNLPERAEGFSCVRKKIVPEFEDVKVLQQGLSLVISTSNGTLRMLSIKIANDQIEHNMVMGQLSKKEQKKLTKILAKMQNLIEVAAKNTPQD